MALEYSSIAWRSEASRVTHQPSHARPHAYYWPANSPYHERSMRCGSEAPGLWHGTRTSWYCRPWKRLLPRSLALTASCIAAPRCCSSSVSCGAAAASGFSAGVAQQGGAFAAVGDAAAFGARRRLELRYHAAPTAMVATPAATRRCLLEGGMARTRRLALADSFSEQKAGQLPITWKDSAVACQLKTKTANISTFTGVANVGRAVARRRRASTLPSVS